MAEEGSSASLSTLSVSKGCFLFNPTTAATSSRKKTSALNGVFRKLPLESDKDVERRSQAYTTCWTDIRQRIEALTSRQHDKVFQDILKFISRASKQLDKLNQLTTAASKPLLPQPNTDDSIGGAKFLPPRLEVPTVALVAGVNMPDHDVLFEQLRTSIRMDGISPHVVLLKSKECNSGMKATMKEILVQLMEEEKELGHEDSDEEQSGLLGAGGGDASSSSTKKRLPLCSMDVLSSWYRESFETMSRHVRAYSPAGTQVNRTPVVIIIEDFEGFIPRILQDLIASLSPHLPEFPVVLVLGLATSVGAIHRILSRSATSLLCIEQFHAQHPTKTLSQIIAEIFLSYSPQVTFRLGPKCFKYLLHQFYYCNFSLTDFTRSLQFSMMDHFYWQPLSVLCDTSQGKLLLNKAQCEMIRATPSFQRYLRHGLIEAQWNFSIVVSLATQFKLCMMHVESLEPAEQIALLENDTKLKDAVKEMMVNLSAYHIEVFPLLECLHCLTRQLPNSPLGKTLDELYVLNLEQDMKENSKFQVAYSLLRMLGRDELCASLRQCLGILIKAQEYVDEIASPLSTFADISELFEGFLCDLDNMDRKQASPKDDESSSLNLGVQETTSERKMRFQERLRQLSSRNKAPSAYDKLKNQMFNELIVMLETHIVSPSSLPLHEVFYFDQITSLKMHLSPSPRASIQTAMSDPHFYLPSAGSVGRQTSLDPNMPDLCLAYQLHLECGRHINLYDWLTAYVSVVQTGQCEGNKTERQRAERNKKSCKEEVDPVLHAQFIQSVSEMQFLGFIKPTQRKTDHVQRLTWGAC